MDKRSSLISSLGIAAWLLCGLAGLTPRPGLAAQARPAPSATASTASLKQYMNKFRNLLASLEVIQLKEQKIPWETVDSTVREMKITLAQLQRADREKAYKQYTDILAAGLVELRSKSAKRDKTFFDSLMKISETCFRCHAAHQPKDYYFPRDEEDSGGMGNKR